MDEVLPFIYVHMSVYVYVYRYLHMNVSLSIQIFQVVHYVIIYRQIIKWQTLQIKTLDTRYCRYTGCPFQFNNKEETKDIDGSSNKNSQQSYFINNDDNLNKPSTKRNHGDDTT